MTQVSDELIQTLARQNDVIISLLARLEGGRVRTREIVTRGKRDQSAYVRLYNALDGTRGVSACAEIAKVTPGTVSPILKAWERQEIIYDIGEKGKPMYRRIVTLADKENQNG